MYANLLSRSPLEESMLALMSLPAYDGDSALVDRWKKMRTCPAADAQGEYFYLLIYVPLSPQILVSFLHETKLNRNFLFPYLHTFPKEL